MNVRQITQVTMTLRPSLEKSRALHQHCKAEGVEYAICASQMGLDVKEHQCQEQFEKYMNCLKKK